MKYKAKLATQRQKEIETHRYFLLFQEYLDKLEKEQPKGGEERKCHETQSGILSPLKRKCGSITGRAIWKETEFTIVTLAKTLNITYLFQKIIRNPINPSGAYMCELLQPFLTDKSTAAVPIAAANPTHRRI